MPISLRDIPAALKSQMRKVKTAAPNDAAQYGVLSTFGILVPASRRSSGSNSTKSSTASEKALLSPAAFESASNSNNKNERSTHRPFREPGQIAPSVQARQDYLFSRWDWSKGTPGAGAGAISGGMAVEIGPRNEEKYLPVQLQPEGTTWELLAREQEGLVCTPFEERRLSYVPDCVMRWWKMIWLWY